MREAASAGLGGMPADELIPILKDKESPPNVLAWDVAHRQERELLEVVLQNVSLPDEAVEALASTLPEHLAELVVINQVRLLRRTSLLEALETNTGLNKDQRRRLRELRETFRIGQQPEPPPRRRPSARRSVPGRAQKADRGRRKSRRAAFLARRSRREDQHHPERSHERRAEGDHGPGGSSARPRDPHWIPTGSFQRRAGSPRDRDGDRAGGHEGVEDESCARSRSQDGRALRVVSNLSRTRARRSPCPEFVPRLNPRDLKTISVDKNVPEVIRKQALKFVRKTGKPEKGEG